MPGIAGMISPESPEKCQHLVEKMVARMHYEGFYVSGTCFVPESGIYGGWVAHQGSMGPCQSAHTNHRDVTLLFTGECYFSGQSSESQNGSRTSSSHCDPDRLLDLYEQEGECFVQHLNGLFSGLLIDRRKKRAVLFNDRYGIERIYFYQKDESFFFASEAKALLCIAPELRAFDDLGVAQYLAYGCTMAERTLFRSVSMMPGASKWKFENKRLFKREQYFSPEIWEKQAALSEKDFEEEFLHTFTRILPRYFSSDQALGISLTGGLDTRMIMAGMPKDIPSPVCYTFCGQEGETLDASLAAKIAKTCGLEHHLLRIGPDFISDYGKYLDKTVFATDGYAGALVAHEIYLNSQARSLSPIRLTGNFGSEILRSMSTFKPLNFERQLLSTDFYARVISYSDGIRSLQDHPLTFSAFREIPLKLFGSLAAGRSQVVFRTPYLDNEIVELAYKAPLPSRESTRSATYFINERFRNLAEIETDQGLVCGSHWVNILMRRLYCRLTFKLDYLHKEGLPHWLTPIEPAFKVLAPFGLLGLHKFLPYRRWFRRELATYATEVFSDSTAQQIGYWNTLLLGKILSDHIRGRKNYFQEINAVLSLHRIYEVLIRGS